MEMGDLNCSKTSQTLCKVGIKHGKFEMHNTVLWLFDFLCFCCIFHNFSRFKYRIKTWFGRLSLGNWSSATVLFARYYFGLPPGCPLLISITVLFNVLLLFCHVSLINRLCTLYYHHHHHHQEFSLLKGPLTSLVFSGM